MTLSFSRVEKRTVEVRFSTRDDIGGAEAQRVLKELSVGGHVTMPIDATSWSPAFGMLIDSFGTPWMISADPSS